MLFLDATHHHAEVTRLDDDPDSLRLDGALDGFGDLGGEALLNLEAARESVDETRDFAQADYFSVGDVGDVHFAEKGQEVVLTQAEHLDVFYDYHLIVINGEQGLEQKSRRIVFISLDEKLH